MLLLFDIDGTLVSGATEAHAEALREALHEVHGVTPGPGPDADRARGRTDGEIARALLLTRRHLGASRSRNAPPTSASDAAAHTPGCARRT